MKRIIMTFAIAATLLGFNATSRAIGLPLGPSEAKADGGFVFYYGGGGHKNGHHAKRGDHGKQHYKDHGRHKERHGHNRHHKKHHGHGNHGANYAKHAYGQANKRSRNGGCHTVSKEGYWHGRYAQIGGTMCYDHYGSGYVVDGSRYLIHYY